MPLPTSSVSVLYQSLANAVDTAAGTILLDLNEGSFLISLLGNQFLWIIPPSCEAEVQFSYGGGVLISASIVFTPPIHVDVRGDLGGALISTLTYDRFGNVTAAGMVSTKPSPVPIDIARQLKTALAFDRRSTGLFMGIPFSNLNSAQTVDGTYSPIAGPASIVSRVRFTPDAALPALAVRFKDHSLIIFSDSTTGNGNFTNKITVNAGSGFQFDELDYFVDERSLSGTLSAFTGILGGGLFSTSNMLLQLQPGANISAGHIDFAKTAAGDITVNASFGTLAAALTAGSRIDLDENGTNNGSFLAFDDGSQVSLSGFSLNTKDGGTTVLAVGGGSSLTLALFQGRIDFAPQSFVTLKQGRLHGLFSGSWSTSDAPQVLLQITLLDFSGVAGSLAVNDDTTLGFSDAVINSSNLEFKSDRTPHVIGTLSTLRFAILPNSYIGIPGGFQIVTDVGGTFSLVTPLSFSVASSFPIGQYALSLPFTKVVNATASSFSLTAGQATLGLETQQDGTIVGTNCSLQGTAVVVAAGLSVSPSIHINGIGFTKPPAGDFTLNGTFQATVPSGLSLSITTPWVKGIPDHDDFRAFPITLVGTVTQPIVIPPTALSTVNSSLSLAPVSIKPAFNVNIPGGNGEHGNSDDPASADFGGPEQDQHRQEAVTDVYPCRVHLYLVPGDYSFHSEVDLAITDGKLDVNISQFQSDSDVGFDRDGCNLGVFGLIVGALTGGLIAGPFGSVIGGVVGLAEGDSLNDRINQMIAAGIANYLLNLRYSWHAQL